MIKATRIIIAVLVASIITSIVFAYLSSEDELSQIIKINSRSGKIDHADIAISPLGKSVMVWHDKINKNYEIFSQSFGENGSPTGFPSMVNHCKIYDKKKIRISLWMSGVIM